MTSLSSRRGFITVLLDLFSDLRKGFIRLLFYDHLENDILMQNNLKSVDNVYTMLYVVPPSPPPMVIHLQKLVSKPYFIYQAASFQCFSESSQNSYPFMLLCMHLPVLHEISLIYSVRWMHVWLLRNDIICAPICRREEKPQSESNVIAHLRSRAAIHTCSYWHS